MAISTWQGQQEPSDSQAPAPHREEPRPSTCRSTSFKSGEFRE